MQLRKTNQAREFGKRRQSPFRENVASSLPPIALGEANMKKRWATVGGCFLVFVCCVQGFAQGTGSSSGTQAEASPVTTLKVQKEPAATDQDTTVYITRTGSKYHRDGCRSLAKSRIPISLKEASAKGFGPCSICRPPKVDSAAQSSKAAVSSISPSPNNITPGGNEDVVVYVTRTGAKYHRAGCRYLARSMIPMPLKEAAARYGPCSVCRPPVPR